MFGQLLADNVWFVAAGWMGLALLASLVSIRVGISVALIEIGMGVIAGNLLGFHTTPWIDFLATFGSGLLTFLAGTEVVLDVVTSTRLNRAVVVDRDRHVQGIVSDADLLARLDPGSGQTTIRLRLRKCSSTSSNGRNSQMGGIRSGIDLLRSLQARLSLEAA